MPSPVDLDVRIMQGLARDCNNKDMRIAELEMILRDVHDPLLISEALLRKHGYNETADMVKEAFDKVAALGAGPVQ
jgi:hypothetical protein